MVDNISAQEEEVAKEGEEFTCSQRSATKVLQQLYPDIGMC